MSFILSAASSTLSWTFSTASLMIAGAMAVLIIGVASKPSFESFEPSYSTMRSLTNETVKPIKRHVKDLGLLIIIQSDVANEKKEEKIERFSVAIEKTTSIMSYGLLNNWIHSDEYISGRTTTSTKIN